MIKKIFTLLIICLLTGDYLNAQSVRLGARGGVAVPNIVAGGNNVLSKGYGSRFSGGGGIFTELDVNKDFTLRFGVEYSSQGGKRNGVQGMSTNQLVTDMATRLSSEIPAEMLALIGQAATIFPPVFYANVRNTAKFDYLMIPVSLQTNLFPKLFREKPWRLYVNAGPFVSFLLSAEQISKDRSKLYASADMSSTLYDVIPTMIRDIIDSEIPAVSDVLKNGAEFGTSTITGEIRPVNFGIQGNLGLSYLCNKNRLFLEVGGNYGFVRLQKDKANGNNSIGAMTVMVGYAFGIN